MPVGRPHRIEPRRCRDRHVRVVTAQDLGEQPVAIGDPIRVVDHQQRR